MTLSIAYPLQSPHFAVYEATVCGLFSDSHLYNCVYECDYNITLINSAFYAKQPKVGYTPRVKKTRHHNALVNVVAKYWAFLTFLQQDTQEKIYNKIIIKKVQLILMSHQSTLLLPSCMHSEPWHIVIYDNVSPATIALGLTLTWFPN